MNILFPRIVLSIICILIFTCLIHDPASAQRRSSRGLNYDGDAPGFGSGYGDGEPAQWGVALQAGFDSPSGDLGESYKGAPLVGLSILKYFNNFTFGITVSRHSYKPAIDDVSVEVDVGGEMPAYSQSVKLTNNKFTGFYASAVYNIGLAQNFKFYGGVNFGGMTSSFGLTVSGTQENYSQSYTDRYSYFAAKLGFDVALSNGFSLGIEGKYNIFMKGSVNTRTGGEGFTTQKSVAGVAMLTYSF